MLSVICPIYNEERYIGACIDSILRQDYPKEDLEVIFADGMSTDRTREIVAAYAASHPFIRLIDNPERITPTGLNHAIDVAKGDIVIRLDAHAEFPADYLSRLAEALDRLGADNVGGVCETLPTSDRAVPRAIAAVLSSRFGMGNSAFRVGASETRQADTVPFGCWHRELFDKIGKFDPELIRNQDDEFNGRTIKNGGKIFLLPDVRIKYFARDKIGKVARMFYQYGLFKPLVNRKLGSPATLRQFVPLGLVIGLILGPLVAALWTAGAVLFLIGAGLYLLLALTFSLKSSSDPRQVAIQVWVYFVVHVSYGWGYLVGLWKLATHQSFAAKVNR